MVWCLVCMMQRMTFGFKRTHPIPLGAIKLETVGVLAMVACTSNSPLGENYMFYHHNISGPCFDEYMYIQVIIFCKPGSDTIWVRVNSINSQLCTILSMQNSFF